MIDLHWNYYWRSHCLLLNQDFYRWQFLDPPDSVLGGGDHSVVAIDDAGRVVSYLGVVPMRASFHGMPIRSAHLLSFLTAPDVRGHGIGRRLLRYVVERFDFIAARSPTPASLPVFQRLGFRYFKNCGRWIAICDPDAAISLAIDPSDASVKRARARAVRIEGPRSFSASQRVPSGAAGLSAAVLSESTAFERSAAMLAWRYEQHPFLRYTFLSLGDPMTLEGIAVLRVEQVRGRTGKVLRVLEFIASPNQGRALAEAVLTYGIEQGCAYADVFGMSEHYVAGLVAAGAFNAVEEADLRLPHLLQPWDPDGEPPGLLFWGQRDPSGSGAIGPVDDMTRVYVSKGDGNMDWPSWIPAAGKVPIAPPTRLAQTREFSEGPEG